MSSLKGRGFSRAEWMPNYEWPLGPETLPSAAKAGFLMAQAARLKACPFRRIDTAASH